jgi:hypothetical protein
LANTLPDVISQGQLSTVPLPMNGCTSGRTSRTGCMRRGISRIAWCGPELGFRRGWAGSSGLALLLAGEGPSGARGTLRAHWCSRGTDTPGASGAGCCLKTSSIILRVRVSLDDSGCVYVRSVKSGSEWLAYSDSRRSVARPSQPRGPLPFEREAPAEFREPVKNLGLLTGDPHPENREVGDGVEVQAAASRAPGSRRVSASLTSIRRPAVN